MWISPSPWRVPSRIGTCCSWQVRMAASILPSFKWQISHHRWLTQWRNKHQGNDSAQSLVRVERMEVSTVACVECVIKSTVLWLDAWILVRMKPLQHKCRQILNRFPSSVPVECQRLTHCFGEACMITRVFRKWFTSLSCDPTLCVIVAIKLKCLHQSLVVFEAVKCWTNSCLCYLLVVTLILYLYYIHYFFFFLLLAYWLVALLFWSYLASSKF